MLVVSEFHAGMSYCFTKNQVSYVWLESEDFFYSYRPSWNAGMSVEELDANEKQAFLVWRRSLARLGYNLFERFLLLNHLKEVNDKLCDQDCQK